MIDTSALFEVVTKGPQAGAVRAALKRAAGRRFVSAATLVEAYVALYRRHGLRDGPSAVEKLMRIVRRYGMAIEAFHEAHAAEAMLAYRRYGKGAGGGALNFGDCFAYALAKGRNDALLFVGEDFRRTDVGAAI